MNWQQEPFARPAVISKVTTMADGSPRVYLDFMEDVQLGEFDELRKKGQTIVVMMVTQEQYRQMLGKESEPKFDSKQSITNGE